MQLPGLNRQFQRASRNRKHLLYFECAGWISRFIENRKSGNLWEGFLEQFQPLSTQPCAQIGNAGNVAPGTGEASYDACLDGVGPAARHNDRNRLGRLHRRSDRWVSACNDENINLKTD